MKRALLILTLIIPAVSSAAENNCPFIAKTAETIMTLRQSGTPLGRMMEIANGQTVYVEFLRSATLEAYGKPRYATVEFQQRAIQDFRNDWEVSCYKGAK